MYIEDVDEKKRILIGKKIELMKDFREDIVNFLFTKVEDHSEENFEGSQDVMDIIDAYIRGDSPNDIGESVLQDDGEPVKEILELFGITIGK